LFPFLHHYYSPQRNPISAATGTGSLMPAVHRRRHRCSHSPVLDTDADTVMLPSWFPGSVLIVILAVVDIRTGVLSSHTLLPLGCCVVSWHLGPCLLSPSFCSVGCYAVPAPHPLPLITPPTADASPPFASCSPAGCCIAPVVAPPPPLVLLTHRLRLVTRRRLLSTSPPGCLLFAGWLSCCILSCRLHLASPFVAPPPHVSILDLLPSFALAGCCVASCSIASTSRPLVNTTAPQQATASCYASNSTCCLPLVRPNWLPRCLLWHLRLTSTSSPSPPPPPLVASCSCPPWLVVVLFLINLQLCNCHPLLPLPPMVGCCIFCLLCHCSLRCMASSHVASLLPILPLLGLLSSWLLHCLPLVRLVVASPLLMLPPPICQQLCLSSCHHLSSCPSLCHLLLPL
jgi:hypothetical protein